MAAKTLVQSILDSSVAASTTDTAIVGPDPVPNGKRVRILRFGGSDVGAGDGIASTVALQWGSGASWETVMGFGLASTAFEVGVGRNFTGNGTKKFRIVRINATGSAKVIIAWVEGYQVD